MRNKHFYRLQTLKAKLILRPKRWVRPLRGVRAIIYDLVIEISKTPLLCGIKEKFFSNSQEPDCYKAKYKNIPNDPGPEFRAQKQDLSINRKQQNSTI